MLWSYDCYYYEENFSAKVNRFRKCAMNFSNKNVFRNFPIEYLLKEGSFIIARSSQILRPETLNDLGLNVIVLVLWKYSCPEVADRTSLQPPEKCSRLPDREVLVCSNKSEWLDFKEILFSTHQRTDGISLKTWGFYKLKKDGLIYFKHDDVAVMICNTSQCLIRVWYNTSDSIFEAANKKTRSMSN